MPDNGETSTDAVLLRLVSESIRTTASLDTKIDLIGKTQDKQDLKLDALSTTLTRIETMNSSIASDLKTLTEKVNDHEMRLRALEPIKSTAEENAKLVEKQQDQITAIKAELIRYGAIAAVILFALQVLVIDYVVPWLHQIAIR